jgi:hypothetical protein
MAQAIPKGADFTSVPYKTTKLYDRTSDQITLDEVERILI